MEFDGWALSRAGLGRRGTTDREQAGHPCENERADTS
jgi:hypothetical protein